MKAIKAAPPPPCSQIKLNCCPWLKLLPSDWHVVAETSVLWQAEYFYRAIKVKLCVWNEKWACWYPSLIGERERKTAPDLLLDLNTNSCLLCCHGYSLNSMWGDKAHPTLLLEAGAVLHQLKTKHLHTENTSVSLGDSGQINDLLNCLSADLSNT